MLNKRQILKLALGMATALLAGGVWMAVTISQKLSAAQSQLARAQSRLVAVQQQLPAAIQRERFAQMSKKVQAQAAQSGFDPSKWAQRRIQRSAVNLSRREVQEQIVQLGASQSGRLMSAEGFELSVRSKDAGIFTRPALDDRGLLLAVTGTLYFPLVQKP